MARFLDTLRTNARTHFGPWRPVDRAAVARLPVYQVALWPDGWELGHDGTVQVRDTHEMAEARRWYALAERNHARDDTSKVMGLYGIFVPPSILAISNRRFPSEQVVSVACQLAAGDWIRERRARMQREPAAALAQRGLSWCGSHRATDAADDDLLALAQGLLALCVDERLVPRVAYGLRLRADDGYGLRRCRLLLSAPLRRSDVATVADALAVALIPWNRTVVRDGRALRLIDVGADYDFKLESWNRQDTKSAKGLD